MKKAQAAALIFSVLNVMDTQAAQLCAKDSEGNWRTPIGNPCYMGQQQVATAPNTGATTPPAFGIVATQTQELKQGQTWMLSIKDITIAAAFEKWSEAAGYKVRWDADRHVLVDAPDAIVGTFEEAVIRVLSSPGIAQGAYPLEVCFYANQPPLARVTRKGEQKDCQ